MANHSTDHRPWSWKIATIRGVPVYIHATFVLLLAWVAVSYVGTSHPLETTLQGFVLVACVFTIVVIHELAHALVARRFGVPTHDITLYPIGGISRLERMPERPREELLVAVAGPASNALLALVIFVGLEVSGAGAGGDPLTIGGAFAVQLMWINISLGAFNLLPAFPMDGGRILRAALAFHMDRARATVVAARIAQALAVVMAVVGVLWSPLLAVIALFVWIAAAQEARTVQLKAGLRGVSVASAMVSNVATVSPDAQLGAAADRLLSSFQQDFPVVEASRVVGMLTHRDVVRGLATHRPNVTVGEVMHRDYSVARTDEDLVNVLDRIPSDGSSLVVVRGDQLVGLIDPDHVAKLIAVRGVADHHA